MIAFTSDGLFEPNLVNVESQLDIIIQLLSLVILVTRPRVRDIHRELGFFRTFSVPEKRLRARTLVHGNVRRDRIKTEILRRFKVQTDRAERAVYRVLL